MNDIYKRITNYKWDKIRIFCELDKQEYRSIKKDFQESRNIFYLANSEKLFERLYRLVSSHKEVYAFLKDILKYVLANGAFYTDENLKILLKSNRFQIRG